jgi:signal transduction histidine kinase
VKMAQELHEGVLQDLYSVSYQLQAFLLSIPEETDERNDVRQIQNGLTDSIIRLRNFCRELRPPTLAQFGLEKAIRSHVESFEQENPEIGVMLELSDHRQQLPWLVRLSLFRIYQEAVSNVAKHSHATRVLIRFQVDAERILLEVEDDGVGFEIPERWIEVAREGRLGLVNSIERAKAVGGEIYMLSSPGSGTLLRVLVPNLD